jgi:altronate hydrolase
VTPAPFHDFALRLSDADNVAVAKRAMHPGVELLDGAIRVTPAALVAPGHKIALSPIPEGSPVIKYGQTIGFATRDISPGDHVHTHNLGMQDFGRDYAFCADARPVDLYPPDRSRTFPGYLRPDGRVGTRNYVAVISSVNCSASVSNYVRDRFRTPQFKRDFPHVDGVIAFTHKSGCCVQPGEPAAMLQRVLAGLARHPNVFGYVMIGLGCEGTQVREIESNFKLNVLRPGEPAPAFMNIQNVGGIAKTVDAAAAAVEKLCRVASAARRTPQPVRKLALAMNCGGSDGASGITANPALGVASDELVRHGGTSVLAETPEIYGAEHLLTRRALTREVGEKLVGMVRWWEGHVRLHGASIDNNPSPGNKEGGLTTIYEKSLGAVAKAGHSPLAAVYKYAEQVTSPGLCFMDTPGFDPVSMTGLIAGGCNVGVFTTGRGSVYGCKPSPCIKVATNTRLYEHMIDDMDLNAGTILDGTETLSDVGLRIFEKIIAVAGGEPTRSELAGIGDEEFAPWILGPTF